MNSRSYDWSLLLLRLTFGGLMILNHGWRKLMKLLQEDPIKFADPLGIGVEPSLWLTVFGEVICPLLLVLGLFTRLAAVPALITMLVAAFVVHAGDPFADKEGALLFAVPYLVLLLLGPGRYSLDHWWNNGASPHDNFWNSLSKSQTYATSIISSAYHCPVHHLWAGRY